jgi:hypothetical protein
VNNKLERDLEGSARDLIEVAQSVWRLRYGLDGGVWGPELSLLHSAQAGSGAHPASFPMGTGVSFPRGLSGQAVKLTTHLQLLPRSRKRGSIPPLPHTPSWRSA